MTPMARIRTAATTALCAGVLAAPGAAMADDMPGEGVTITMAQATWDTGWFPAEVYKQLLEELGYTVDGPTTLDNPPFYESASFGDLDLWVNGWFPLHNTYLERVDNVELVGYVVEAGALEGYLIDRATAEEYGITHIEDILDPEVAQAFDATGDGKAEMVGCPPGWGCEDVISHHFEEFGWDEHINVISADYAPSMADALARYEGGESILFYTWTPNWTVSELVPGEDVVWLQMENISLPEGHGDLLDQTSVMGLEGCQGAEECNLGFPANDIRPVANADFIAENPAVRALLENASIDLQAIFDQNALMHDGEDSADDIARHAAEYIEANRDQVDEWLQAARDAS